MTIEELEKEAEEYVKKHILKHNRDVVLRPKNAVTYIDELKQAYLDGLTKGRKEKWHDLRKDPNDLPKESGEYWGYVNYYGFQHRTIYWSNNQFELSEVIAWCELPKFEE